MFIKHLLYVRPCGKASYSTSPLILTSPWAEAITIIILVVLLEIKILRQREIHSCSRFTQQWVRVGTADWAWIFRFWNLPKDLTGLCTHQSRGFGQGSPPSGTCVLIYYKSRLLPPWSDYQEDQIRKAHEQNCTLLRNVQINEIILIALTHSKDHVSMNNLIRNHIAQRLDLSKVGHHV